MNKFTKNQLEEYLRQQPPDKVYTVEQLLDTFFIGKSRKQRQKEQQERNWKNAETVIGKSLLTREGIRVKCLQLVSHDSRRGYRYAFQCPRCETETFECYRGDLQGKVRTLCGTCKEKERKERLERKKQLKKSAVKPKKVRTFEEIQTQKQRFLGLKREGAVELKGAGWKDYSKEEYEKRLKEIQDNQ